MAIPHELLESAEWAQLSAIEVKLLIDLYAQFNGRCNGALSAAWSIMRARGWCSQDTLNRALRGLIGKGFIVKTRQGGRNRCSLFAVTWREIQECGGKHDVDATSIAGNNWKKNCYSDNRSNVIRLPEQSRLITK